jgi:hypothetical protein
MEEGEKLVEEIRDGEDEWRWCVEEVVSSYLRFFSFS